MDRITLAVAIGMALVFAIGIMLGVIAMVSIASNREDRPGTFTRQPPKCAGRGLNGAGLGYRRPVKIQLCGRRTLAVQFRRAAPAAMALTCGKKGRSPAPTGDRPRCLSCHVKERCNDTVGQVRWPCAFEHNNLVKFARPRCEEPKSTVYFTHREAVMASG
jgi:hypothetical protein